MRVYFICAFGQSDCMLPGEESVFKNKVQFALYKLPSAGSPAPAACDLTFTEADMCSGVKGSLAPLAGDVRTQLVRACFVGG